MTRGPQSALRPATSIVTIDGFAADVVAGLTAKPKQLPPKYFYDAAGSALFEQITRLPEYYPTRCELALLHENAVAMASFFPSGCALVEFGSGSSRKARILLGAGAARLVGVDLIKSPDILYRAYNDAAGVTAKFNLNLLGRINRELDADFDLRQFEHVARFNEATQSVEMHLRARHEQSVAIRDCGLTVAFAAGETIWTESSHKYTPQDVAELADASGFAMQAQWIDEKWPFANSLLVAA